MLNGSRKVSCHTHLSAARTVYLQFSDGIGVAQRTFDDAAPDLIAVGGSSPLRWAQQASNLRTSAL